MPDIELGTRPTSDQEASRISSILARSKLVKGGIFCYGLFQTIDGQSNALRYFFSEQLANLSVPRINSHHRSPSRWVTMNKEGGMQIFDLEDGVKVTEVNPASLKEVEDWGKCYVDRFGFLLTIPYDFRSRGRSEVRINSKDARRNPWIGIPGVIRIDLHTNNTLPEVVVLNMFTSRMLTGRVVI